MLNPYIGQICIFPYNKVPRGWVECNGLLLQISEFRKLYSIIGTTFGGDGRVTFALPNLKGAVPLHPGNGISWGEKSGEALHHLTEAEIPPHTHFVYGSNNAASDPHPNNNVWANSNEATFNSTYDSTMNAEAIASMGKSQGHNNMQPYTVFRFCIAVDGDYPSHQ